MGINTNWQEKLKDRFPKEEQKKEREHDERVLSKEQSREFEFALKKRLRNLREDVLRDIGEWT